VRLLVQAHHLHHRPALPIPLYLNNGDAFPQRNLILFITFIVILLTLTVQGLTLPYFIKKPN
jgi:CPA1 family monovalent cation:H+ antiporter